jgi:single-stranded-DNA-specific exonuclease
MDKKIKIKSILKAESPAKRRLEIVSNLLTDRGLTTKKLQQEFLNPKDPQDFSLKELEINSLKLKKAVLRIKQAIKNKELIFVYGDFDADGVTSTAVLWETLHSLKANAFPYIPPRDDKIRGLSPQGIDEIISLKNQKPGLIITVDNGISAFKGVNYAKKKNIDIIITDHHLPKDNKLPPVHSIVHSTKIAGVGVAWVLANKLKSNPQHLGLVALGSIADMMPLVGINRSIAKHGIEKLQNSKRPGLIALAELVGFNLSELEAYQASFIIGPRLNAMGRLSHALDSLRLLCTTDIAKAKALAIKICQTNQLRQDQTLDMYYLAKNITDKVTKLNQNTLPKLIFVADKSFHEGLVGLVASRLVESFHRPAIVVALGKSTSKASARSIEGFNAIKNIRSIEKDLLEHGGHPLAAGFTIDNQNLEKVKTKLLRLADQQLTDKQLTPTLEVDLELSLSDINWELYNDLESLHPFGFGNPRPVFISKQVLIDSFRPVGQNQKHLKLTLQACPDSIGGQTSKLEAIAFNLGHLAKKLSANQSVDLIYTLDKNVWNGQKTLQFKIKEIII